MEPQSLNTILSKVCGAELVIVKQTVGVNVVVQIAPKPDIDGASE
jgi:hypothetical protein